MSVVNVYHKILDVPKNTEQRTQQRSRCEELCESDWVFFNTFLDFCASDSAVFYESFFELTPAIF